MFASSRVDKGGAKFRPVAKPRPPRPSNSSTPTSSLLDGANSNSSGPTEANGRGGLNGPTLSSGVGASRPSNAIRPPTTVQDGAKPSAIDQYPDATSFKAPHSTFSNPSTDRSLHPSKNLAAQISQSNSQGLGFVDVMPSHGVNRNTGAGPSQISSTNVPGPPSTSSSVVSNFNASTTPGSPPKRLAQPFLAPSKGINTTPYLKQPFSQPNIAPVKDSQHALRASLVVTRVSTPIPIVPSIVNSSRQVQSLSASGDPTNASPYGGATGPHVREHPESGPSKSTKTRKRKSNGGEMNDEVTHADAHRPSSPKKSRIAREEESLGPRRSTRARKPIGPISNLADDDDDDGRSESISLIGDDDEYHGEAQQPRADENVEPEVWKRSSTKSTKNLSHEDTVPRKKKRKPAKTSTMDEGQTSEDPRALEHASKPAGGRRKRKVSEERQEGENGDGDDTLAELEVEYDEDGNPLPINPEVVTMAQLCDDIGIGRVSSRTEESVAKSIEWKKNQRLLRQKAREKQKAKFAPPGMYQTGDSGDVRQDQTPDGAGDATMDKEGTSVSGVEGTTTNGGVPANRPQPRGEEDDGDFSTMQRNQFAAQVRLDENGDIILDDLSLTVDRHEAARVEQPVEEWEIVEEAEKDRFVNNMTYSKKISGSRWTKEETEMFYYYHSMWGTDFEMISHMMVGRTRREIKNKYNAESRKDPRRLDMAFTQKVPIDLEEYAKTTGLDLSGPVPKFGVSSENNMEVNDGDETLEEIHFPDMDENAIQDVEEDPDAEGEKDDSEEQVYSTLDVTDLDGQVATESGRSNFGTNNDGAEATSKTAPASIKSLEPLGGTPAASSSVTKGRGMSVLSATTSISIHNSVAAASKLQKGKEQGRKNKNKSKRKGLGLADDEEVIGTVG